MSKIWLSWFNGDERYQWWKIRDNLVSLQMLGSVTHLENFARYSALGKNLASLENWKQGLPTSVRSLLNTQFSSARPENWKYIKCKTKHKNLYFRFILKPQRKLLQSTQKEIKTSENFQDTVSQISAYSRTIKRSQWTVTQNNAEKVQYFRMILYISSVICWSGFSLDFIEYAKLNRTLVFLCSYEFYLLTNCKWIAHIFHVI